VSTYLGVKRSFSSCFILAIAIISMLQGKRANAQVASLIRPIQSFEVTIMTPGDLRVCPRSFGLLAKFSDHQPD
jgi:hypothetical protein